MSTIRRIYRIDRHGDEFQTGLLPDGTQILLVPTSLTQVAVLRFDASGFLVSSEEIASEGITETADAITLRVGAGQVTANRAPIEVGAFSVPSMGVEIRSRPESFEEFLRDPVGAEPDSRYRERTLQQIQQWDQENRFVLATWGKAYWMNGDGSVFAT